MHRDRPNPPLFPIGFIAWCCVAIVFSCVTRATPVNLLQDGGFESAPAEKTQATAPIGDGWIVTAGAIHVLHNEYAAVPHGGSYFAYLDDGYGVNTLTQTLATVPGQSYTITYYVADTPESNDRLTVKFGDQTLFSGIAPTFGVTSPDSYVRATYTLAATAALTDLSFTGQYGEAILGDGTILDDVSVTPAPEPSPVTGMGTIAFILLGRRPRRTARVCFWRSAS